MEFYTKITKGDGCFIASFPDFSNINTYGESKEEAIENATEALNACLESDFDRGFELPKVKHYNGKNFVPIAVFPHIALSYQLRQLREDRTQLEIAKELGISYQAYQKLENPRKCNPTVKNLEKISLVLGKRLEINFA
jgi:antitoxin HicB